MALGDLIIDNKKIQQDIDHVTADAKDISASVVAEIHGLLDRLNGTKLTVVNGGVELSIPPRNS